MQDDGLHWVGSFATTHQAPDLLTSKRGPTAAWRVAVNGALETELKAVGLQLEVCIQVPKALKSKLKAMELQLEGSVPRCPRP